MAGMRLNAIALVLMLVVFATHDARRTTHDARRTTHDARRTTHDARRAGADAGFGAAGRHSRLRRSVPRGVAASGAKIRTAALAVRRGFAGAVDGAGRRLRFRAERCRRLRRAYRRAAIVGDRPAAWFWRFRR